MTRNLDRADIGIGDAGIFGLSTGVATEHVRVSKQSGGGTPPQLLRHPGIRIRIFAQRELLRLAEKATPASDGKGIYDTVTHLQIFNAGTELNDLSHELVAEDIALHHGGNVTVIDMQIRAADGRGADTNDCIARIENLRIWHIFDPQVCRAVPTVGFHDIP